MKLYVNRSPRVGPWGGGNLAIKAVHEHASQFGVKFADSGDRGPDTVLLMGLDSEERHLSLEDALRYRDASNGTVKVVLRLNDNDARKGTRGLDDRVLRASSQLDGTIFVSQWMYDTFHTKGWACPKNVVIVNGVETRRNCSTVCEVPKQRSIVSHHWSDNLRKSGDITSWIDDFVGQNSESFRFTFIGRTKLQLKNTHVVSPLHGTALWNELGSHHVYVSESLWDPGPNHCIEPISLGIPTYVHKNGGGCVEFAGSDHTYETTEDLERILRGPLHLNQNGVRLRDWKSFASDVFSFLKEVHQ